MNPFSFGSSERAAGFDDEGSFVPDSLPEPGPFLVGGGVLTGTDHVAVHGRVRDAFDARGVYDATFGYNLAKLNRDRRHPDAGLRYARTGGELRVGFTPTTPFCPQSRSLTVGTFRALNDLPPVDVEVVRVRVDESHQAAAEINDHLARLEERFRETGSIPSPGDGGVDDVDGDRRGVATTGEPPSGPPASAFEDAGDR